MNPDRENRKVFICSDDERALLDALKDQGILEGGKIKRWKLFSSTEREILFKALDKADRGFAMLDQIEGIHLQDGYGLWP